VFGRRLPRSDPSRFTLGVALPTGGAPFATREDGQPRDFARALGEPRWPEHAAELAALIRRASGLGVRVIENLTAPRLGLLFEDAEVATLIAHAPERGAIELCDVVVDADQVVHAVPPSFRGFVDLVSCHSEPLADVLRFQRDLVVLGHGRPVELRVGLMVYGGVLADVVELGRSYEDALTRTLDRWMGDPSRWH
jgi:hypothetical protein